MKSRVFNAVVLLFRDHTFKKPIKQYTVLNTFDSKKLDINDKKYLNNLMDFCENK